MSAPHQPLPWCCCIKDGFPTLFQRKWFAMTSTVPSLLPACCCLLSMKPLLSLPVSAPLISPVSPTHFSCLCHSLHHTLKSSLPHSTAILLPPPPSLSHDGLHETQCHDYTDIDERWRLLSATSVLNKYCVDKPCTFSPPPFLRLYYYYFFKCCRYADLVSRSCHQHQTRYLFLVRRKICSQITLEASAWCCRRAVCLALTNRRWEKNPIKWSSPAFSLGDQQTGARHYSHAAAFHATRKCVIDVLENKVRKKK